MIKGGFVKFNFDFTWKLTGLFPKNGTGAGMFLQYLGFGISNQIIFAKDLKINK
jgi:hypothetical protein